MMMPLPVSEMICAPNSRWKPPLRPGGATVVDSCCQAAIAVTVCAAAHTFPAFPALPARRAARFPASNCRPFFLAIRPAATPKKMMIPQRIIIGSIPPNQSTCRRGDKADFRSVARWREFPFLRVCT